jgi:uroporphyrinogen-III synthase
MAGALDGLRILVPETREIDLLVSMLEADGAQAVRCPLVRTLDVEDTAEIDAWISLLLAGSFQDIVWLTGEGLRRLIAVAERQNKRDAVVRALRAVRSISRGPKPIRALRELGLEPGLTSTSPTSQGVLDVLAREGISGRRIGVQLYPDSRAAALLETLRARGAVLFPVTPYRYATEAEDEIVANAIRELAAGTVHVVAFTSSPQVDRLIEVAHAAGLGEKLRKALAEVVVAAVGPVVEEKLNRVGVEKVVRPDSSFHLKPLVRAIAAARSAR